MKVINDLVWYQNLKIVQDTEMFNFSLDSVLLPNFVTLNKNIEKILDIGCGNCPIPLILSTKTSAHIVGVEIQKDVYELAQQSVKLNKLTAQISLINEDINILNEKIPTETFDVITCNPPFFQNISSSRVNKNDYKTIARHEVKLNLSQLMKIAKKLLKNNGRIALVHRPERLLDILTLMRENNIEPKKICFVYPKKNKDANILLIEGVKNGKKGLKILPPLYVHDDEGNYTKEVQSYFK